MTHILITGANRGIGLALAQQYADHTDAHLFAACRKPDDAAHLHALAQQHPGRISLLPLDITREDNIHAAVHTIQQQAGKLDVLINNAGINPKDSRARRLGELTGDVLQHLLFTNAIAPLLLTQACLGLLKAGSAARVVMVSSQMGSLEWTHSGGGYGYRMSKTAMNMAARTLAMDLKAHDIISITLHPGWVQTDMGGEEADLPPDDSAAAIFRLVGALTLADSGRFFKWTGEEHAW